VTRKFTTASGSGCIAAVAAALQALSRPTVAVLLPVLPSRLLPEIDLGEEQVPHGLVLVDGVEAGAEVGDKATEGAARGTPRGQGSWRRSWHGELSFRRERGLVAEGVEHDVRDGILGRAVGA
jgi:hypothetical protein